MAFQTNVFRDGEWVTETVSLHSLLKSQKAAPQAPAKPQRQEPPRCGLLTRTVVESALANSILPVRLRSSDHNDIAFVGDHFVQICELRRDGSLREIARKNDFGCRIRNACVIGSFAIPEPDDNTSAESSALPAVKTEDDHASPFNFTSSSRPVPGSQLPPQLLLVVLETGENVFLFVRPGPNGKHKFIVSRFENPRHMGGYPGFHTAVDPSSRYMALGGPADYFVVYELDPHAQLNERYLANESLRPIRSFRLRSVRGVIHKMTFLYPRSGDDHHIILLLVIVRHGKSRTVLYEWELGDDLKTVFAEEKQGHRMPVEYQMPLLLIPLTVQSAFITISANQMAVCTESLHGPPKFDNISMPVHPPTINHRGRLAPLWTAWTRPFRLQLYRKNRDCIYLAREDGLVLFMEADEDGNLTNIDMDPFPCNISNACAGLFGHSADVLVLGSESGPGGYWKIPAREPPEFLGTLPNWAPVVDFTTTDDFTGWHQEAHKDKTMVSWQEAKHRKPDRVFATCDGGSKGSITEYRYGLKASIGLDLEYGPGMKQAWLLPFHDPSTFDGYLLLVSMPDSTTALLLSSDFSSASAPAAGMIPYDLSSTTLAFVSSGRLTIQITMNNIVLASQQRNVLTPFEDLPGLLNVSVSDACVFDDCIAISAHTEAQFQIHVFKVDPDHLTLTHAQTIDVEGEVTCLSVAASYTVLAGIRNGSQTLLGYGSLQQPFNGLQLIDLTEYVSSQDGNLSLQPPSVVEGIESIVSVRNTVILGTRSGEVMTVRDTAGSVSIDSEKFGMAAASVSYSHLAGETDPTILVTCNNALVSINLDKHDSHGGAVKLKSKYRVWPVDASKPEALAPPVHFATAVDMPASDGVTPILMISGSRLLLAEMHRDPGLVHRSIPVDGTPNRVIYCRFTQCLVAAVNQLSGPTLKFINPDTGEDIGRPVDKNREPQPTIAGLGKKGDRILALSEWNYRRDGNVWNFILVATKDGRLIVVTTEKVNRPPPTRDGNPPSSPTFRYWTRFRKQVKEPPIFSVAGYDEGLIYCAGQTVYWEVLDTEKRQLVPLKSFALGSPATGLRVSNGKLVALTSSESLVVLDHVDKDEEHTRVCHVDPWRRNGVDAIEVAGPVGAGVGEEAQGGGGGITLVADRECGVAGLWVPWQTPDRECEVVFEAELMSSVRKFRRGRTRPVWEQRLCRPRFGRLPATADDAEILGVSLNGAMYQFSLLSVPAWRLLRFIQNVAGRNEDICPFAVSGNATRQRRRGHDKGGHGTEEEEEEDLEPKLIFGSEMHVDGDILRRCLEKRALERVVVRQEHVARFIALLGELDSGEHTAGLAAEGDHARYFGLAYDVLEYYLLPAL